MRVDYIIFTHLPAKIPTEKDPTPTDPSWEALQKHGGDLATKLRETDGVLVIFLDAGWPDLLDTIGKHFDPTRMTKGFNIIPKKQEIVDALVAAHSGFTEPSTNGRRIRLITAETLLVVINNLRGNKSGKAALQLRRFLVSEKPGVR